MKTARRPVRWSLLIDPAVINAARRWIGRSSQRALQVENALKALIAKAEQGEKP